mmetsp:Transcript_1776/g.3969  ORF Transcript_1776/g.3969 Transcript_1776/m.3969 type:complete len:308 (-) Transcript_1776:28-951(-)
MAGPNGRKPGRFSESADPLLDPCVVPGLEPPTCCGRPEFWPPPSKAGSGAASSSTANKAPNPYPGVSVRGASVRRQRNEELTGLLPLAGDIMGLSSLYFSDSFIFIADITSASNGKSPAVSKSLSILKRCRQIGHDGFASAVPEFVSCIKIVISKHSWQNRWSHTVRTGRQNGSKQMGQLKSEKDGSSPKFCSLLQTVSVSSMRKTSSGGSPLPPAPSTSRPCEDFALGVGRFCALGGPEDVTGRRLGVDDGASRRADGGTLGVAGGRGVVAGFGLPVGGRSCCRIIQRSHLVLGCNSWNQHHEHSA